MGAEDSNPGPQVCTAGALHPLSPLSSPEPLKVKEVYAGERVTQIRTNDRGEVNLLLLLEIGLIPLVYRPFLPSNKKKPTSQLKNRPDIGRQLSKEYINGPQTYEKLLSLAHKRNAN